MTKSATSETPSDPAPHKQNFYLGVLAGAAIGAGIAYLSSNKKGNSLKKEILAKAKKFSKQIPDLLDELNIDENDKEEQPAKIQKQIAIIQKKLNTNKKTQKKTATDQNDTSEPNLTTATKIAKTVKNTGKKAKRFFTKAGRMLKK